MREWEFKMASGARNRTYPVWECFIFRIPLLYSMLLIAAAAAAAVTTAAVIAAAVRAQCLRLAIVFVTQFHYQKRALVLLFHFISFRSVLLDEVVFVENNFLCIFFFFLYSLYLPLPQFSSRSLCLRFSVQYGQPRPEHYSKWIVGYIRDRSPTRSSFRPHTWEFKLNTPHEKAPNRIGLMKIFSISFRNDCIYMYACVRACVSRCLDFSCYAVQPKSSFYWKIVYLSARFYRFFASWNLLLRWIIFYFLLELIFPLFRPPLPNFSIFCSTPIFCFYFWLAWHLFTKHLCWCGECGRRIYKPDFSICWQPTK